MVAAWIHLTSIFIKVEPSKLLLPFLGLVIVKVGSIDCVSKLVISNFTTELLELIFSFSGILMLHVVFPPVPLPPPPTVEKISREIAICLITLSPASEPEQFRIIVSATVARTFVKARICTLIVFVVDVGIVKEDSFHE